MALPTIAIKNVIPIAAMNTVGVKVPVTWVKFSPILLKPCRIISGAPPVVELVLLLVFDGLPPILAD